MTGKRKTNLEGALAAYLYVPLALIPVLVIGAILTFVLIDRTAGEVFGGATAVYAVAVFLLYIRSKRAIGDLEYEYGKRFEYGQKRFQEELLVPYAVMDEEGTLLWMNREFAKVSGGTPAIGDSIRELFPDLTPELYPREDGQHLELALLLDDLEYTGEFVCINTDAAEEESDKPFTSTSEMQRLLALYLRDDTILNETLRRLDDEEMVTALVYIDNYEELIESIDEVRQSLMTALIDREVSQYAQSAQGVAKKLERDKYMLIFQNQYLEIMKEDHFSLLKNLKGIRVGNGVTATCSMGIGLGGSSYAESYRFARLAIDLALGRGGDQVIIKDGDKMTYFGGKKELPRSYNHVKARAKADALREFLISKERIIVMGHKLADVDSFGAAMGIYRMARTYGKTVRIVIDEVNVSLAPLLEDIRKEPKYQADVFIDSQEALRIVTPDDMLIVVDTSRPSYTMCPPLLERVDTKVVIDHHRKMQECINDAVLSYIEPNASSASEMVAELMQYIHEDIKPWPFEADALYAGIIIDTNNFATKTGARTFEAAAYLRRCGADIAKIRKVFRDDIDAYRAKAQIVQNAEIYRNQFAISTFAEGEIPSPTIIGAQAANELLNISNIRASFVLTLYKGTIYVSARSIDEINVQIIMERLGGGGHMSTAGAQFPYTDLERGVAELKETIDTMIKEGNIE